MQELRRTPLFTADVLRATVGSPTPTLGTDHFPQYGLLAKKEAIEGSHTKEPTTGESFPEGENNDRRLFLNTNTPWSAFICGSQGSGKSHTLSCMLEAALLPSQAPTRLGKLPEPLAAMVFHYDKFSGHSGNQLCEAAYLCSKGIPVKVLVSPANFWKMEALYTDEGKFSTDLRPTVHPMFLEQKHIDAARMMKLMAVDGSEGTRPLYMEVGEQ